MPSCPKRALEAGASDPVAAADPVACGSQRLHSSLGAEGAIVPGGGWWGQWGVCTQKERMRLEKLPPGLQSPGPPPDLHRDPFTTPIPFPHQLPAAFARLLRVGTAGAGGSLAPPLRLPPEKLFWVWELSSTSGPDGPLIRLDALGQEGAREDS